MSRDLYLVEEIQQLIEEVFNSDWTVKLCGRDKCKQLMHSLNTLYPSNEGYGDTVTGFLNTASIKTVVEDNGISPFDKED